jgi:hypothetical protein
MTDTTPARPAPRVSVSRLAGALYRWLLPGLYRWLTAAVPATLAGFAAVAILRFYGQGDGLGIAAVVAVVLVGAVLYGATLAHDATNALGVLAGAAVGATEALEEIEKSAAEIEHAAGLLEESSDVLTTSIASPPPLSPDPAPAPAAAGAVRG